jgi:hypothetical protein
MHAHATAGEPIAILANAAPVPAAEQLQSIAMSIPQPPTSAVAAAAGSEEWEEWE